jgi:iron complex outermembrane receptor protein
MQIGCAVSKGVTMNSRKTILRYLLSTAMGISTAAFFAAPALAAPEGAAAPSGTEENSGKGSGTRVTNPEEIIVTGTNRGVGGGLMKIQVAPEAISSVTAAAISQKMPAASPLQLVATMPGANFGTSDAYGLTARNTISVRGLDQTELGWLLEGMPAVDQSNYFPFAEGWADNENIAEITLTAGNSRLQDPIVSSTGGEFIMTIRDPDPEMGARVSGSIGSNRARRGFASIDTGYLGDSGLKAFGSFSKTEADTFIGFGRNKRSHIDFKMDKDWGGGSESSLFVAYSNTFNARIAPITQANFNIAKASGDFDQFTYAGTYPAAGSTNYWKSNTLLRRTLYLSFNNKIALNDDLTLQVTPYFHYGYAESNGATSLLPSSIYSGNQKVTADYDPAQLQGGRLYTTNTQTFFQYAEGVNSYIEYNPSDTNHLMFGYWYDRWDDKLLSTLGILDANGNTAGTGKKFALRTTGGEIITGTNYKVATDTNQFFVGDTQSFLDNKLKLSAGLKFVIFHASGDNSVIGPQGKFGKTIRKWMPRASVSYDIDDTMQLYANITTNARMPLAPSTYLDVYNLSTGRNTVTGNLGAKAETSVGEQLGFRYYGMFNFDFNLFNTKLRNRQIQSQQLINGVLTSQVISAGDETIRGVSGEVSSHRYFGFAVYANGQYLHTRFDDDIPVGADFLPTRGKNMVLSPKWMASAGLNYDDHGFFGNATYKYVGRQYTTFVNDETMPSYQTLDLSIGYHLPSVGFLKSPTISANFNNLTAGKYLGVGASVTGNAFAVTGVNGATIAASKPTYYLSAPFSAMLTISTGI